MLRTILPACLLLCVSAPVCAQSGCDFGSEKAADVLVSQLEHAPSCKAAAAKLRECQWGSSADTQFGAIVILKCERDFFAKLGPKPQKRYIDEMQLCAYQYSRSEGTYAMSEAAMCQVDVAEKFAKGPAAAGAGSSPRASFDCAKAQLPLEVAICSDGKLGRADVVLGRVYESDKEGLKGSQREALIQSERDWLAAVPKKCGLTSAPFAQPSLNCLRNEFELRFTVLDDGLGPTEDWVNEIVDQGKAVSSSAVVDGPSASFDCETPSSAVQLVVCDDHELGQQDIELASAFKAANAAIDSSQHDELVLSEKNWLKFVNKSCPLGVVGGIPSVFTRGCIGSAFDVRIAQLRSCPAKEPAERLQCLNNFRVGETDGRTR